MLSYHHLFSTRSVKRRGMHAGRVSLLPRVVCDVGVQAYLTMHGTLVNWYTAAWMWVDVLMQQQPPRLPVVAEAEACLGPWVAIQLSIISLLKCKKTKAFADEVERSGMLMAKNRVDSFVVVNERNNPSSQMFVWMMVIVRVDFATMVFLVNAPLNGTMASLACMETTVDTHLHGRGQAAVQSTPVLGKGSRMDGCAPWTQIVHHGSVHGISSVRIKGPLARDA